MFQCRTQHDVCWDLVGALLVAASDSFNAARSMMCVGTPTLKGVHRALLFQCRTQHDVCWDSTGDVAANASVCFNAARSMMCVGTLSSPALVPRGL